MKKKKTIALVAHDNRKQDLMDWVKYNWKELISHDLVCTGTTGSLVKNVLHEKCVENNAVPPTVKRLKSGPLGGRSAVGSTYCGTASWNFDLFLGSYAASAS